MRAKLRDEQAITEMKNEINIELNFISVLFYTILITMFAIFAMLMLNPTIDAAFPIQYPIAFDEYFELHKEQFMIDLTSNYEIENLKDLLGAIILTTLEGFFSIFTAYVSYVFDIINTSQEIRLQIVIRFAINLIALGLIYLILYFKQMRAIPIIIGFILGFAIAYLLIAFVLKIIFIFFFFGYDYAAVAAVTNLNMSIYWFDFNNMLTTMIILKSFTGVDWVIFWVVFMLIFNFVGIITSFLLQRLLYPVKFDKYHIPEKQTLTEELDEQLSWIIFHTILGAFIGIGLRKLAQLITMISFYDHRYAILMYLGLVFAFYYINKFFVFELFKFFFNSSKSIIVMYRIKKESIIGSLAGSLIYSLLITVTFFSFYNKTDPFSFYIELFLQMLFLAISIIFSKIIRKAITGDK